MITFPNDEIANGPEVGDKVQVKSKSDLNYSVWVEHPVGFRHILTGCCLLKGHLNQIYTIHSITSILNIPTYYMYNQSDPFIQDSFTVIHSNKPDRHTGCECGKDIFKFMSHSTWCPKWVSPY